MTKNPARVQEDEAVLNAKSILYSDKDGDIDWIIKDINDTASENHKKNMLRYGTYDFWSAKCN